MSLYKTFKETKKGDLQKSLNKKNIHQVPEITKVIVTMGIGSLATRKSVKDFSDLESNIMTITGQKPQMILSRKSVSNFKLREGMPAMLKCTLRGERAYDFLERLIVFVLPSVRDFEGLSTRKFDGRGNYNVGFKDQSIFGELSPEDIKTPMGLQITICTSTESDEEAKTLLTNLGVIFTKKL